VTLQACLAPLGRRHALKAANQSGFLTAGTHVLATRPMACLARLLMMNVRLVKLDVRFVAGGTELIISDHLGVGDLRDRGPHLRVFTLSPSRRGLYSVRNRLWLATIGGCRTWRPAETALSKTTPIKLAAMVQLTCDALSFLACRITIPLMESDRLAVIPEALPPYSARSDCVEQRAFEKVLPMSIKSRVTLVPRMEEIRTRCSKPP
jgi:hypothetical protein